MPRALPETGPAVSGEAFWTKPERSGDRYTFFSNLHVLKAPEVLCFLSRRASEIIGQGSGILAMDSGFVGLFLGAAAKCARPSEEGTHATAGCHGSRLSLPRPTNSACFWPSPADSSP